VYDSRNALLHLEPFNDNALAMGRLPQLDGLRGIAILMVFATHALHVPGLWMGVDLFFVLSGYLITRILLRLKFDREEGGYWRPFYNRRALRILPPYIGFVIFLGLVFAPRWHSVWWYYIFFGSNLPLAFGIVPIAAVTPLWSLAVEEQFYFIWPWVALFCSNRVLRRVAFTALIVTPILRAVVTPFFHSHMPVYALTPFRADTLACGAFIAISQEEEHDWVVSKAASGFWLALAAGVILLCISATFTWFRTGANHILFNAIGYSLSTVMFGGSLVYVLGGRGVLCDLLAWSGLRYMGRISYTFYLYHVAVLSLLEHQIHDLVPLAVASFAVTSGISALSWRFIESPILRRGSWKNVASVIQDASRPSSNLVAQKSESAIV